MALADGPHHLASPSFVVHIWNTLLGGALKVRTRRKPWPAASGSASSAGRAGRPATSAASLSKLRPQPWLAMACHSGGIPCVTTVTRVRLASTGVKVASRRNDLSGAPDWMRLGLSRTKKTPPSVRSLPSSSGMTNRHSPPTRRSHFWILRSCLPGLSHLAYLAGSVKCSHRRSGVASKTRSTRNGGAPPAVAAWAPAREEAVGLAGIVLA